MTNRADFAPEQVADVIRAGLREVRRPARMSAGRAAERAATHRNILARCREHAQQSRDADDYLQGAEKSWGAYAQTVKAIVADHRWRATHHGSIIGVAGQLASLAGQMDSDQGTLLDNALNTARSLPQHFYEDDLPQQQVINAAARVADAIDLLQELFPPEPNSQ